MYSLEQLKELWKQYEESNSYSVYKDGKWEHSILRHKHIIKPEGVRCKMQKTSETMDFIEYLEQING